MAASKAVIRRRARQEELREYLSKQKIAVHILKRIDRMGEIQCEPVEQPDGSFVNDVQAARLELDKLKAQNADSLKLLNKFLPDLKCAELDASIDVSKKAEEMTDSELLEIAKGVMPTEDDEEI